MIPRRARLGDCIELNLQLVPEGNFVPEPLFDTTGQIHLILGWGNYLPGLHELLQGCSEGDVVENVSIDAGWGERREDLIVTIPLSKVLPDNNELQVGMTLQLLGMSLLVQSVNKDAVTLDANPPLAGSSYVCSFRVLKVKPLEDYATATFALGCFWGAELAFMRLPGVIGTRVGYTQGIVPHPTYEQVCQGETQHREAVQVVYDPDQVTYEELVHYALERLSWTASSLELHRLFEGENVHHQYRYGVYFDNQEQQLVAQRLLADCRFGVELLEASEFYIAEEKHQQYLYKGGQSARKGAKEIIRCYG